MMQLEELSQRFVGVQGAVVDLMTMVRLARNCQRPMAAEDLRLLEQALFGISGELVMIPADLTAAAAEVTQARSRALHELQQCQRLLAVYEAEAEANGLIPAIIRDRQHRTAEMVHGDNVVLMPDRLSRAFDALNRPIGGAS